MTGLQSLLAFVGLSILGLTLIALTVLRDTYTDLDDET